MYLIQSIRLLRASFRLSSIRAAADAIKFTVDQQALSRKKTAVAQQPLALSIPSGKFSVGAVTPTPNISTAATTLPSTTTTPAVVGGGAAAVAAAAERRMAQLAQLEKEQQLAAMVCSLENKEACLMCGS